MNSPISFPFVLFIHHINIEIKPLPKIKQIKPGQAPSQIKTHELVPKV